MRAQDKGARIFWALMGLAPVVATASFPLINLPKFYLSFTILVSLILVKYPDRVGWYLRYLRTSLYLTSMCLDSPDSPEHRPETVQIWVSFVSILVQRDEWDTFGGPKHFEINFLIRRGGVTGQSGRLL